MVEAGCRFGDVYKSVYELYEKRLYSKQGYKWGLWVKDVNDVQGWICLCEVWGCDSTR
jgi:hypothetical protein